MKIFTLLFFVPFFALADSWGVPVYAKLDCVGESTPGQKMISLKILSTQDGTRYDLDGLKFSSPNYIEASDELSVSIEEQGANYRLGLGSEEVSELYHSGSKKLLKNIKIEGDFSYLGRTSYTLLCQGDFGFHQWPQK